MLGVEGLDGGEALGQRLDQVGIEPGEAR